MESAHMSRDDAAVLAAINLADELYKQQEGGENLRRQVKTYLDEATAAKNEAAPELRRSCSRPSSAITANDGASLPRRVPRALEAAVQTGADAVYMGFGASTRAAAPKTFTDEEFADAVAYCHLRGVRVFLTLNTLLTDRELPQAAEVLRKASRMGVDAVLVQDWGVLTLAQAVSRTCPHASTQMSLFTSGGARWAERLGMERVVLARELSRDDIANVCRSCGAEIEVFVHGALCMCYSGQCR